ncbi:hypothetical protein TPHA_0A04510 [Tetrapisispora phaffii CBS 4417]|uniref:Rad21/Rec8-like protein N-terminal domain-containing protein n=1 Tax=Tetrapisispora phaffii (strain ATCC 24235 / CBS 4417 / NBRC 1672 / NRRL Y-8282 / UCD 70-5) TaxID=1071381 RepID=G8BNP6_TETPH|nr:hypothetical protein TPHA_0A04510 [Tetrapisispora phaffii CBS 4417]CCE61524.1 hypothetical protein TPHA_0A04510 [Tetrapisispora phaffii CBS 4417]
MSTPYSTTIQLSTKSGPLAQIWLASNMSNISRGSILQTNITESVGEIAKISGLKNFNDNLNNDEESISNITLRTSGELLQGIVRVYSKQATFLLSDIKDALIKISSLFKSNQRISMTLSKENTIARIDQLFLQDQVTENDVLSTPGLEFLNETTIPEGLNTNDINDNNSMQRKVTGAALDNNFTNNNSNMAWDTSIEIGRRFNPDNDLENYHSSALDLDFDLYEENHDNMTSDKNNDTGSKSGSWIEGTGSHLSQNSRLDTDIEKRSHLIHDSDFALDSENVGINDDVDWDLGITESNGKPNDNNDNNLDRSIELGRRASIASQVEQPTDFGFDLDIGKDLIAEEELMAEEEEDNLSNSEKSRLNSIKKQKPLKHSELTNARKLVEDVEIELKDEIVRRDNSDEETAMPTNYDQSSSKAYLERMTEKRLNDDIVQSLNYIPSSIVKNYIQFDSKRFKLNNENENDLDMNLSFVEDDMISASVIENNDVVSNDDNEDESDHLLQLNADLSYPETDVSADNLIITMHDDAKVKLVSGEVVSKNTTEMAELLRNQFIDNDKLSFGDLLRSNHNKKFDDSNIPISKHEASKDFFEMLSLATAGCVDLHQDETFGSINIQSRSPLYEKFVEA